MTKDEYRDEFNKQKFKTQDDVIFFLQSTIVKILDEQEQTINDKVEERIIKEVKRLDAMAQEFISKKLDEQQQLIHERTDNYCKTLEEASFNALAAQQKECAKAIDAYKKKISELEEQVNGLQL